MAKRAFLAELLGFLSCKDPRKQDGELSISIGAPSESVRCDVIVVLSDLSQRENGKATETGGKLIYIFGNGVTLKFLD